MAKDDDIIVIDNGTTYETEESTLEAKQYAEQAKQEADRSEENANRAETAIQIAADAADLSRDWAIKLDGKVVENEEEIDYSSKYYAQKSQQADESAETSATVAKGWAVGEIGERPEGSAKYWAEKSQESSGRPEIVYWD